MEYLDHLLRSPGREVYVLVLAGADEAPEDAGAVLDDRAKQAYRRRVDDLEDQLAEAERLGDRGRASRAREELEAVAEQLASAVGLGGRDRKAASNVERARVNVQRRLRDSDPPHCRARRGARGVSRRDGADGDVLRLQTRLIARAEKLREGSGTRKGVRPLPALGISFPAVNILSAVDRTIDVRGVREALDVDRRLAEIPASAQVRGWIFKMTADEVARHGPAAVATYRRLSPVKSTWFFRMYSVRDFVQDAAAGAAAINPNNPHAALRAIWRNAPRYAPLFNAQRFTALLKASPLDAVRWLEAQRDMFWNYGGWRVEARDEDYFVIHYFDEYIWIESAHVGGTEGVLYACSATGSAEPDLDSPFNGRIHVRWRPGEAPPPAA